MSRRVQVISYYFAPQNAIGAVRPTKLVKYLARQGVEVTVLCGAPMTATRDPLLARDAAGLPDVRVISERSLLRSIKTRGGTPARTHVAGPAASRRSGPRQEKSTNRQAMGMPPGYRGPLP